MTCKETYHATCKQEPKGVIKRLQYAVDKAGKMAGSNYFICTSCKVILLIKQQELFTEAGDQSG